MKLSTKPTPKNLTKPIPVEIRPYQEPHFKRMLEILSREIGVVDTSPFGAGKTHIQFALCATFKLNMMIFCPKSTISNWKKWGKLYGVNIICLMSYQSLRGQNGRVNHPLLKIVNGEYVGTELLDQYIKSGLMMVFDEYHNLKGDNTQLASAHALVKSVVRLVRMGCRARVSLLSHTPCTEKESVTSTFKMLGIITSDKLYNYNHSTKKYERLGIQEAIDKCNEYDKDETLSVTCRSLNKTTAKTMCYDLYVRVLKRFFVSSMPPPPIKTTKVTRNLYILMPDRDVERLKKGLLLFKSATNYKEEIQEVNMSGTNWGDVTTSRMEIDSSKIWSTCRHAQSKLENNKKCQIMIYCNYKRDMETAMYLLDKYNPLVMNGQTSSKNRDIIIEKFQRPTNEYRVLISNPKVGGIGIDLDDKFGDRPRIMYILPSYFFTDQFQATGRHHREGTKSTATVYFIYSRAFPYETGILNSMAVKTDVVKNMVINEKDAKFPGDYQEIIELTPDEIKNGNTISVLDVKNVEVKDITYKPPTTQTKPSPVNKVVVREPKKKITIQDYYNELNNFANKTELELDKYHAYSCYIESIKQNMTIYDSVQAACDVMVVNISERCNLVLNRKHLPTYKTEQDLIQLVEGFTM